MSKEIHFPDLLRKKRDGGEFTAEELKLLIKEVVNNSVESSQIGAMLMAMYIKGLNHQETINYTRAIIESGEVLKWKEEWHDKLVDKHSTGGCGDKVSLALAPALSACGFKVPMLSGRSLSHTGGTLDKLESIPGFKAELNKHEMEAALEHAGCFIAGASMSIAPGDKELYKYRDVTGTIDSIPLITGSILSKKVAEGTNFLVVDVKVGSAAFFKTVGSAQELASKLISVSKEFGLVTNAAITRMDVPIGRMVGNALEVAEAIECMKGNGPADLVELVCTLGAVVLKMKGQASSLAEGKEIILRALTTGIALEKFQKMLVYQGVDSTLAAELCRHEIWRVLPQVHNSQKSHIKAYASGFIESLDALMIAEACWKLGAGRSKPEQQVDHRVGIQIFKGVGEKINEGDIVMEVHHATEHLDGEIRQQLRNSVKIGGNKNIPSLIIKVVDK